MDTYSNKTVTSAKRKRVISAGILGSEIKCPFRVSEGVKMISAICRVHN